MGIQATALLATAKQQRHAFLHTKRRKSFLFAIAFLSLGSIGQALLLRHFGVGELAGVYHLRLTGYLFFICGSFLLTQGKLNDAQYARLLTLRGLNTPSHGESLMVTFISSFSWLVMILLTASIIPYGLLFGEAALAPFQKELTLFIGTLFALIIGFAVSVAATRSLSQFLAPRHSPRLNAFIWLAPLVFEVLQLQHSAESFFSAPSRSLPGFFLRALYSLNTDYLGLC